MDGKLLVIVLCTLLLNFSVADNTKGASEKHVVAKNVIAEDKKPSETTQITTKTTKGDTTTKVVTDENPTTKVPTTSAPTTIEPKTSDATKVVTDENPTTKVPTTSAPITIEPKTSDAPLPIPTTKPVFDGWNVTDHGVTCIKLMADIEIKIPYAKKNNQTDVTNITVPHNATSSGSCKNDGGQMIELKWLSIESPIEEAASSILKMQFVKDDKEHTFSLFSVNATIPIDDKHFPEIKENYTKSFEFFGKHLKAFSSPLNMSYICKKESEVHLLTSYNATSTVRFVDVQLQAFKWSNGTGFDKAVNCEALVTPDIVPIIVGCTLALLVIIVLIAYLIGRKRAQARGYLSM